MPNRFAWATWPDHKLLQLRLKDLKVTVNSRWLQRRLRELYEELEQRGLWIKPHAWIAAEWFSPSITPGIAIPFYLAHPRLMRLEKRMIIDVEGGTVAECRRILRHEAGHAIQYAYQLHRRREWQQVFGRSTKRYPDYYRPNPGSRRYVQHLRLWYAQSHPDEDFAETFAVWLRPRSDWRTRYAEWPALKKLEYVDKLMTEIAYTRPIIKKKLRVDPITQQAMTLGEHYKKKQALYAHNSSSTYDRELLRIFSNDPRHTRSPKASEFIRHHRTQIRETVSKWTGEYQLTLDHVLGEMVDRCRKLDLRAAGSERQLLNDFTLLLTAKTVHSLYSPSRRQWFAL